MAVKDIGMEGKNTYLSIYTFLKQQILDKSILSGYMLPPENELALRYSVSRPTITKVYNKLQDEGLVRKRKGYGTEVIYLNDVKKPLFGLLLPGAGESEIFALINDKLLAMSGEGKFDCLWEGATASNAKIRSDFLDACVNDYIRKGVDGILFSPLERVDNADIINREICRKIDEAGIPVVLIDRDIVDFPSRSTFDLVCIDNFNAGYVMGEHLVRQGCENVCFFYREHSAYSVRQRISGVRAAVQEHGLVFGDANIFCGDPGNPDLVKTIPITGRTGVVCANDSTAALLMSSFDELGKTIGKDLLICGYDDMKYAKHLKCPLTSYWQPCESIAVTGVELLQRRMKNRKAVIVTATLTGKLIPRESTTFLQED